MGRLLKYLMLVVAGVVVLVIVAAILFSLLFDANDFREQIAAKVKQTTGRELVIEGDLDISLFPWLAVDVGRSVLGNAEGFGDEPFASFEQARLSVRLLPLILRREITVGTAELDSLDLNLAVLASGRSNWDDLLDEDGEAAEAEPAAGRGAPITLDVRRVDVRDSRVSYANAESGDRYELTKLNITTGRVAGGDPVPLDGGFAFEVQPADMRGEIEIDMVAAFDPDESLVRLEDLSIDGLVEGLARVPTTLKFATPSLEANTAAQTVTLGDVDISVLGIDIAAVVEPFSYAGDIEPAASIEVDAFSPRSLLQRLGIEAPETADPNALGKLIIDADAKVSRNSIALSKVNVVLDDTKLTGALVVPRSTTGTYRIDLVADTIDLTRYMAPADPEAAAKAGDEVPIDIPDELIRPLNARGNLKVGEARLGALRFENVTLGLNSGNGRLRLHPVSATLFEGSYEGDVNINVAGATPVLAVNERISGVKLGPLIAAVYDSDKVTGTINGAFRLTGRGDDLAQIQRSLDGSMSFELKDGAYEGVDFWHVLRSARALTKKQPIPEAQKPARTEFSSVTATGPVTDGVFRNDDLLAEIPFLRLTGKGRVDLAEATVDYDLTARVLERPEFAGGATEEELDELTKTTLPLKVQCAMPLSSGCFKFDFGRMLKERAKDEIRDKLSELLGGRDEQPAAEAEAGAAAEEGAATEAEAEPEPEKDLEDQLKDRLKDLLKR